MKNDKIEALEVLETVEISHSQFDKTLYLVRDQESHNLKLEDGSLQKFLPIIEKQKTDNYNHDPAHFSELNKKRKRYIKTCPQCNEGFEGLAVQVFCSGKCRQRNKREKDNKAARAKYYRIVK